MDKTWFPLMLCRRFFFGGREFMSGSEGLGFEWGGGPASYQASGEPKYVHEYADIL